MSNGKLKLNTPDKVRVRLAPSPTGPLHIGTVRTALFNYLFARQNNGEFILRIEDTDRKRSKKQWEKNIMDYLHWLGLDWDEGPDKGGPYAPYSQSRRLEIYASYIQKLLDEDKAYYCFCTQEELMAQKEYHASIGEPPRYLGTCRKIDPKEAKKRLADGEPAVIRLKTPTEKVIAFDDLIYGKTEFNSSELGDFIIAKSTTEPLYNLAVVIDDYLMKITHVMRGAEHISNTPKQIILAEFMGIDVPEFAHLPLVLGPTRRKLSKREDVVAISDYQKSGYLAQALINFIILLGWSEGADREIYSMEELIEKFSLEKVQKSPAIFDIVRLNWMNGHYIRQESLPILTNMCLPYLIEADLLEVVSETKQEYKIKATGEIISLGYLEKIVSLYQERLKVLSEVTNLVDYFLKEDIEYPTDLLIWKGKDSKDIKQAINKAIDGLSSCKKEWNIDKITEILLKIAEEIGDRGTLLWPVRVALTGKENSAGPFEVAAVLGFQKTITRLKKAYQLL